MTAALRHVPVSTAAARAVVDLLAALGLDPEAEGLADTPLRVADMFIELLTPEPFRPTTFPHDAGYDELVLVSDISFKSLCEHHLRGAGVVVEAEHLCMSVRGVRADGARTVTSALHGHLRDRPAARQEFLQLAHHA